MEVYVSSRGFLQDEDYHWKAWRAAPADDTAQVWSPGRPGRWLHRYGLLALADWDQPVYACGVDGRRSYLYVSTLGDRRDFFGSPVRDAALVVTDDHDAWRVGQALHTHEEALLAEFSATFRFDDDAAFDATGVLDWIGRALALAGPAQRPDGRWPRRLLRRLGRAVPRPASRRGREA